MPHSFTSCRLTTGNVFFPITVEIDDCHLYYSKGFVIGRSRMAIPRSSIASVLLINRIVFSDLIVETQGGGRLFLNGFTHGDARRIYRLLRDGHRLGAQYPL